MFSPQVRGWSWTAETKEKLESCFPRRCGGDPIWHTKVLMVLTFSPQVRGWSRDLSHLSLMWLVFPAGAGVILCVSWSWSRRRCFPRRCGGDPAPPITDVTLAKFSPQVRGWSLWFDSWKKQRFVFPAGAGVILAERWCRRNRNGFPRRCGGDPLKCLM